MALIDFGIQIDLAIHIHLGMDLDPSCADSSSDSDDSSCSDSSDDDGGATSLEDGSGQGLSRKRKRCRLRKIHAAVLLSSILSLEGASHFRDPCLRTGNLWRDRKSILLWASGLEPGMFRKQFRVCREDFEYLVGLVSQDLEPNWQKAINSSGSPITTRLQLMIMLRMLAGASYLDLVHYHVHANSVHTIMWKACRAVDRRLDNIKIAETEAEMVVIAKQWADLQFKRWGVHLTVGTLYAGDGLAVEIEQPSVAELRGRPISVFRNRKGFWGLIIQGFCDAYTRFAVFDVKWPGGTNDIVAYPMTELYRKATSGHFPAWCTFVLDEAYSSCGGMHLTPFSIHQLRRAKAQDRALYFKMIAFCNVLSSQRITIERAFGILVRRWGILWRMIEFSLSRVPTIVRVCAKLHNLCVDRWLLQGRPSSREAADRIEPEAEDQIGVEDGMPAHSEIMARLHNNYVLARARSAESSIRMRLVHDIYNAGIRTETDTEFNQIAV
mmetsp:Transcript_17250/g.38846  ORF Transcript_17250/g.38846 Transcript_17250/m.38846 type:complete len:496 (+) Transcript_17250:167-1654(+)